MPAEPADQRLTHILLVVDQLGRTLGGGERIVLRMAALLPRFGYRASILTFAADDASPALTAPAPCPMYLLPLSSTYDMAALRAAFALRSFIRRENVRIVQTFFESSDIWAGTVTKAMSRAKLIWSRRDMGILRTRKHHLAYKLLARMPDRVFAVSEQVRQHCIGLDGIRPERVLTVYNGLDVGKWSSPQRSARTAGSPRIVALGNVRRVKGHDVLIRAAAILAQTVPEFEIEIVGQILEAEFYSELQQLTRELGLEKQVHFPGGTENPAPVLGAADLFVLPSRSEGFSNVLVEAMAAGLPVVATDVGGNAEAIEDGKTGLIVPTEDANALAAAMARLLLDPAEAERMGDAGKRRAEELFTTSAMMEKTTSTYDQLLKS